VIDRDQLEAKAKELETALDETRDSVQNTAVTIGIGVVILLVIAFLIGRRRGKKGGAVVEVYKI
jgi:LPXTG-motif cell wall-anchored protein